ncbi:hypothetical protein Taro_041461 [Colocasia esculenta]|uniref:RNase H type-1 domain-containing protein n=1 Tax=Colocasia esculenta TaxID=4460 RepID=A0A843WXC7_COLES|nr:hypothetical protein [Colocasia esculenta]
MRDHVKSVQEVSYFFFEGKFFAPVLGHRINFDIAVQLAPPGLIRWFTPPQGRLKLNVDGAFKRSTGAAGGKGILRNSNGDIVFAFSAAYPEVNSSIEAEALALHDGLSICCDLGILSAVVESDSLILVQIMNGKFSCPWRLLYIMHDVSIKFQLLRISVSHGVRLEGWKILAQ